MMTTIQNDNALENVHARLMVQFLYEAAGAAARGDYADAACSLRCAHRYEKMIFIKEEGEILEAN